MGEGNPLQIKRVWCHDQASPYSSNCLFGGEAADATPTFCFSVPAISKLTTLTVDSSWTAPTETAKHHILAIDEAS